ncbi:MAG: protein kinase [Gemmatales bacterium]|nr:protein kinase [Gemmatales bacterium]MDW7995810.1 protein kinase [Gemmatales bacterium]
MAQSDATLGWQERGISAVIEVLQGQGWQLEAKLGRGSFGEVYRARFGQTTFAVRINVEPIADPSDQKEQKIRELSAKLRTIVHPRLASLMDYQLLLGHVVTVWQLADEPIRDLSRLLQAYRQRNHTGLPREKVVRYVWHLAEVLDFLNGQGLYHRNVKPHNCLLFQGDVKLGDFGMLQLASLSQKSPRTLTAGLIGYAPPEVWEGKHHPTCDLYALAVMYVYLLTGRHPFGVGTSKVTPIAVIERQRRGEWDLQGLSENEAEWVKSALHPDPQARFNQGARPGFGVFIRRTPSLNNVLHPSNRRQKKPRLS